MRLKDKARAKAERRAAKKTDGDKSTKPGVATDEEVLAAQAAGAAAAAAAAAGLPPAPTADPAPAPAPKPR